MTMPTVPRWLVKAYRELAAGVVEIPGPEHEQRILQYHQATTLKATEDEIAWCSSFLCWIMAQSGIEPTRSAAARSWLWWGSAIECPVMGCVTVVSRGRGPQLPADARWALDTGGWSYPQGHVGLFVGFGSSPSGAGHVLLLAGNQGNRVSIRGYPIESILGHRWPLPGPQARTQET